MAGELLNIGGGYANSLSLLELFDLIREKLQIVDKLEFRNIERRNSDQAVFIADITKAKQLLD